MSNNTQNLNAMQLNDRYPVFEPNQLLTSGHLNQLRNYLDLQDRFTRTRLIGIGILCGLEVKFQDNAITVTAGTGVTSEGFLVNMGEEQFKLCSEPDYFDPENYVLFADESDSVTGQINMWELLPEEHNKETFIDFSLPEFASFLNDKVVIIFVEYKDIELENCLGDNCDDQGIKRQFTTRKLLIKCEDADRIIREAYEIPFENALPGDESLDGSFNARFNPDYMAMPAFSFQNKTRKGIAAKKRGVDFVKIDSPEKLNACYAALFPNNSKNPVWRLTQKLEEAYHCYQPILENEITSAQIYNAKEHLKELFDLYKSNGALQYFYDFTGDLIAAYNAFIDIAFEIISVCVPNENLFPRHLILGKVTGGSECPETESDCRPKLYRTHFIQSSIYNQQKIKVKKARFYFRRLLLMIESLRSEYDVNESLKITPSKEQPQYEGLDEKSIPFYFKINQLYRNWSFEKSKRCKADRVLSYHSDQYQLKIPSVQFPLQFAHPNHNFYRIEGLLGKNVNTVKEELETLQHKHQLDFNLVTVAFEKNIPADYPCGLDDISEAYTQLRNEIIAEVEKYNWILTRFMHIINNLNEVLPEISGKTQGEMATHETDNNEDNPLEVLLEAVDEAENLIATLPKCIFNFSLSDFNQAFKELQEFSFIIAVLFERIMRALTKNNMAAGVLMAPALQNFIERYFLVNYGYIGSIYDLNDILRSQIDVKVKSLYYSFKQRLNAVLENQTFNSFINHNPGLNHMAGVPKGGTFVMVHKGGEESTIIADFALHGKNCCCKTEVPNCGEVEKTYNPLAKNVYYFISDDADQQTKHQIDVIEFSLDLNVEELDVEEIGEGVKSEKGGALRRVENEILNRAVIEYTLPAAFDTGIDKFEYTIVNESGKKDVGCVFIAKVPMGNNLFMETFKKMDELFTNVENKDSETDETEEGKDNEPDKQLYGEGLAMAELYGGKIRKDDNIAHHLIDETKYRYKEVDKIGTLPKDATDKQRLAYERKVVGEFKTMMKETGETIHAIELQLGKVPENPKAKMKYMLEMEDKFAERDALVALYEDQAEQLGKIAEQENLMTNKNSALYKFIDTDVRKYADRIANYSLRTKNKLSRLSKSEQLSGDAKSLFDSFKK